MRDTRESGTWITKSLAEGLLDRGVDVVDAGVLCTPSVAYLVKAKRYQAGVVISASHNPPEFNGIKFFTPQGRKWPDAWELSAEKKFASKTLGKRRVAKSGTLSHEGTLQADYEGFLVDTLNGKDDFSGLRIALDCSNGANSTVAPELFRRLGADIVAIGVKPNGKNINVGCGSQHTEKLSKLVVAEKCHLGIAFDGDADRVILVDEAGRTLDGDHIIAMLSKNFKRKRQLKNNMAVITVMANLGLKKALKEIGVKSVEVAVGDRYVSEAMSKTGSVVGGEQSGHIILGAHLPTGDGLLTALHVVAILKEEKKPLSRMAAWIKKYPQTLLNLPVKERIPLAKLDGVQPLISSIQKRLGDNGRVLVRYSGTEPLLRIMIEAAKKRECDDHARQIAWAVTKANDAAGN